MLTGNLGLSQDLIDAVKAITEASCSAKKMEKEELVGGQKKLDKNGNGKLDADDFKKLRKEEAEELDELSQGTLANYTQKAAHDVGNKMHHAGLMSVTASVKKSEGNTDLGNYYDKTAKASHSKALDRLQGIKKAANKIAKQDIRKEDFEEYSLEEIQDFMMSEDFEQLDELSKKTLGSYVKHATNNMAQHGAALAHKQATAAEVDRMTNRNDIANKFDAQDKMKAALGSDSKSQQKDYDKIGKRQSGISKAINKLTKEQVEEIEMLAAKHGLGE
jgi:hypothetical protein